MSAVSEQYIRELKLRRVRVASFDHYPFSLPSYRRLLPARRSFFNVATDIERMDAEPASGPSIIDSYGGRSLHEQSHGESFFALLLNRLYGHGLYILDEPEAVLSPTRQLAMLTRIHQLVQSRSQFIIATHSPISMAYPNASLYQINAAGLSRIEYRETEHYIVAKRFLNDPSAQLEKLLS